MRAAVLTAVDGPFELRDIPEPEGGEQVLVRVRAAGINFADVLVRRGRYPQMPELPAVLGSEIAGELEDGTRVMAITSGAGGYAEVAAVDRGRNRSSAATESKSRERAPQITAALAAWRPAAAVDGDLVFLGSVPDRKVNGDALSVRYRDVRDAAGLRPLRFHDLRHTFGSLAVDGGASLVQVQGWMGHSDIKTTMRYLHSKSRTADAELLGRAFTSDALEQMDIATDEQRTTTTHTT